MFRKYSKVKLLFFAILLLSSWLLVVGANIRPSKAQDEVTLDALLGDYTRRDGEDPFTYEQLASIEVDVSAPSADACAVPIMSMGGQGYHHGGSDGGLDILPTPDNSPFSWTQPSIRSLGTRPIIILIVDQFGTYPAAPTYHLGGGSTFNLAGQANPFIPFNVYDPSLDQMTLDMMYHTGYLTHGQLVFNHANSELALAGLTPTIQVINNHIPKPVVEENPRTR
jgi:hypothetical protein